MKTLQLLWNTIKFEFNQINRENNISEDFNFHKKVSYATLWVKELLKFNNEFELQIIIWQIFNTLYLKAKEIKLDYLQIIEINWISIFWIDNWDYETLLLKEEY